MGSRAVDENPEAQRAFENFVVVRRGESRAPRAEGRRQRVQVSLEEWRTGGSTRVDRALSRQSHDRPLASGTP